MLTVASPRADQVEIDLRARAIQSAISAAREHRKYASNDVPVVVVYSFPRSISAAAIVDPAELFAQQAEEEGILRAPQIIPGSGFIAIDGIAGKDDAASIASSSILPETHCSVRLASGRLAVDRGA